MVKHPNRRRLTSRSCRFEQLESRSVLAAGGLDLTFGNGGVVDLNEWFPTEPRSGFAYSDTYSDLRVGADGKIDLIVRDKFDQLEWVHFDKNGNRDLNFGTDSQNVPGSTELETTILPQVDFDIARYFSDGTLDHVFDDDGWVDQSKFYVQPDGTIDVLKPRAGNTVLRTTFDQDGQLLAELVYEIPEPMHPRDYQLDAEGRLIALSLSDVPGTYHNVTLVRFNQDGTLDSSFGDQGVLHTDVGGSAAETPWFALQPSGGILVWGIHDDEPLVPFHPFEVHIQRFHENGTIDQAFGDAGMIGTGFDPFGEPYEPSMFTDPQGNILVTGSDMSAYFPEHRELKRFRPDGSFDEDFSEAATEALRTLNICQFYTPQIEFVDGNDVVMIFHDGPVEKPDATCNRTAAMIKLSGDGESQLDDAVAEVRVAVTDLDGNPVSIATKGQQLKLSVFVSDKRETPAGVFAAYVDLHLVIGRVTMSGPIEYGDHFPNGRSGSVLSRGFFGPGIFYPGTFDETGGFGNIEPPGSAELLLFSAVFTVDFLDPLIFRTGSADELPAHRILLYGQSDDDRTRVDYGRATIAVVEPPPSPPPVCDVISEQDWYNDDVPADVNRDGFLTPMDVLVTINLFNRSQSISFTELSTQFAVKSSLNRPLYVDANNDGHLGLNDVLVIFNAVNAALQSLTTAQAYVYGEVPLNDNERVGIIIDYAWPRCPFSVE